VIRIRAIDVHCAPKKSDLMALLCLTDNFTHAILTSLKNAHSPSVEVPTAGARDFDALGGQVLIIVSGICTSEPFAATHDSTHRNRPGAPRRSSTKSTWVHVARCTWTPYTNTAGSACAQHLEAEMSDAERRHSRKGARNEPTRRGSERQEEAMQDNADVQTTAANATEPFVTAYRRYYDAAQRALGGEELQRRLAEAHRTHQQQQAEAVNPRELREQAAEAYRGYANAAQEAASLDDLRRRATEAFAGYQRTREEALAPERVRERAGQAWTEYVRRVQEALAPEEVQQRANDAHRAYAEALRQAWSGVAADQLDPITLGTIAQTIAAAAALRAAALAALRQRWAAAATVTSSATALTRGPVQ
jgi:hypothetical protein